MVDLLVIGAGVIGSWISYEASRRGLAVAVLDKKKKPEENNLGLKTAVVHTGAYFEPGLEITRHLIRGRQMTVEFARKYRVPHEVCGKLMVVPPNATSEMIDIVERHFDNAIASGVEEIDIVYNGRSAFPGLRGEVALHVPGAAILDVNRYLFKIRKLAEDRGVVFLLGRKFISGGVGHALVMSDDDPDAIEELHARRIVNAAGLESDIVARSFGATGYEIKTIRSEYLYTDKALPFRKLVYPFPFESETPGAVHYAFHIDGSAYIGPWDTAARDRNDYGMTVETSYLNEQVSPFLEGIGAGDPRKGFVGLHPRLYMNDEPVHDFVVHEHPEGVLHLPGIESPGFTSAPSIALEVVDWVMG